MVSSGVPPFASCFVKDLGKEALFPVIHRPFLNGFKKVFKKFYFRKVLALPSRIFFLFFGKSFIPQLQDMGIDGFQAAFGVKDRRTVREDDLKVILPFFQTGMSQKVLKAPLEDRELMRGREYKRGCRDISCCVHVDDDDPFFWLTSEKEYFMRDPQ